MAGLASGHALADGPWRRRLCRSRSGESGDVGVAEGYNPYDVSPGVLSGDIVEAVDPMWMQTPAPYGPLPLAYGGAARQPGYDWLRAATSASFSGR